MALMQHLEQLLDDLRNLEVNTIKTAGLTAQRMPAPMLAIHNIITAYERFDDRVRMGSDHTVDRNQRAGALLERFGQIRLSAKQKMVELRASANPDHHSLRYICSRINESASTLIGILNRAQKEKDAARGDGEGDSLESVLQQSTASIKRRKKNQTTGPIPQIIYNMPADLLWQEDRSMIDRAWQLSKADRAHIRKIWEIGTEAILAQTVIQIEGDVTNRISPAVAEPRNEYILDIHQRGIDTSLKMWANMVTAARALVGDFVGLFGRS
jgi:hypothetical protein